MGREKGRGSTGTNTEAEDEECPVERNRKCVGRVLAERKND